MGSDTITAIEKRDAKRQKVASRQAFNERFKAASEKLPKSELKRYLKMQKAIRLMIGFFEAGFYALTIIGLLVVDGVEGNALQQFMAVIFSLLSMGAAIAIEKLISPIDFILRKRLLEKHGLFFDTESLPESPSAPSGAPTSF